MKQKDQFSETLSNHYDDCILIGYIFHFYGNILLICNV